MADNLINLDWRLNVLKAISCSWRLYKKIHVLYEIPTLEQRGNHMRELCTFRHLDISIKYFGPEFVYFTCTGVAPLDL